MMMGCIKDDRVQRISLVAMQPLVDVDNQPYIPLMYVFPWGQDIGVNQDSALVRPFYKVLHEGKPVGTISYIFYQDDNRYYILGSFVYSIGGKIIYFPGAIDRRLVRSAEGKEILGQGIVHDIDHISLENNLRTYHVTMKQKATEGARYPKRNTLRIKDDIFHWFSMGVKEPGILEAAPKTQEIKLKWRDHSDLKRKYDFINRSRGGCKFNITCVDDVPGDSYYINFEFFVSPTRYDEHALVSVGVYQVGLSYDAGKDPREKIFPRIHHVILKGYPGSVWVRVSKIIGDLNEHVVYLVRD